jgi:orotidine-5'-phosphate decarboxylase
LLKPQTPIARQRVRQAAGKGVTIVSTGTGLNKSTEEQAAHIKRIAETADAVVVGRGASSGFLGENAMLSICMYVRH